MARRPRCAYCKKVHPTEARSPAAILLRGTPAGRMGADAMPYWCAQIEPKREATAVHFLELAGYQTYLPKIREHRAVRPLFPGYCFVLAVAAWYPARWSPGVVRLIGLEGMAPAQIPDAQIAAIKSREREGLVRLPPPPGFARGARVQVARGLFAGQHGLYEGMRGTERVVVLLQLLGRVELNKDDIVRES